MLPNELGDVKVQRLEKDPDKQAPNDGDERAEDDKEGEELAPGGEGAAEDLAGLVVVAPPDAETYELQSLLRSLGQSADLASDWLSTLVQPIRSHGLLVDPTLEIDYNL